MAIFACRSCGALATLWEADLTQAQEAIDRLAAVPTDPLNETCLLRLRALLARARGEGTGYRACRDRYRELAKSPGFEGQMKWAEAMAGLRSRR
jgi:adenylate cyclase